MSEAAWRIVLITTVPPVADAMVPVLRELGHEPVAILSARRAQPAAAGRPPTRPGAVLGLPVAHSARRPAGTVARFGELPSSAAAAPPRPDPALVGLPRRRRAVRRDLAPHGRRA